MQMIADLVSARNKQVLNPPVRNRAVMNETIGERHASACRYKNKVPEGSRRSARSAHFLPRVLNRIVERRLRPIHLLPAVPEVTRDLAARCVADAEVAEGPASDERTGIRHLPVAAAVLRRRPARHWKSEALTNWLTT